MPLVFEIKRAPPVLSSQITREPQNRCVLEHETGIAMVLGY